MPHSPAFLRVRDLIVDRLDEADRRRLAALLGAMKAPQPALSLPLTEALAAIAALETTDRERLARW